MGGVQGVTLCGCRQHSRPQVCTLFVLSWFAAFFVAHVAAIGKNPGKWGPVINLPVIPVAAAVLPTNKLLMWSAELPSGYASPNGVTQTGILDLNTMQASGVTVNLGHNMFCPGLSYLLDGTLMVNGGANNQQTSLFSLTSSSWSKALNATKQPALMNIKRGYNGDATMPDGRVFTIGGSWSGGWGGKNGEIFTLGSGWQNLPGASATVIQTKDPEGLFRSDNQPWLFALGGNIVFHAGPSKKMNFFDVSGTGSSYPAGLRGNDDHAMNGIAVMYAPNKILTTGGAFAYSINGFPATPNAHLITLNGFSVASVETLQPMKYARSFHNGVVLPDGDVLILGGQSVPKIFTDFDAVFAPELWSAGTKTFRKLVNDTIPRTYHSVALLLPDGRVFSGGGGLCDPAVQNYCPDNGGKSANHLNGRIFTPPNLLNPDGTEAVRPVIQSAPSTAKLGSRIRVVTNSPVAKFSIVRYSAVTHSMNSDQRRVPLTPTPAGTNTYLLTIPANAGTVLRGYYMLFAMNSNGVPSVSMPIRIT